MAMNRLLETVGLMGLATISINCAADDAGPATCAEAKSTYGVAVDGPQTLYIGGDKTMPWRAYCADMATAEPREYLTLDTHDDTANYATFVEYTESGNFFVDIVYHRVRIDPVDLTIDTADNTFAVRVEPPGAPSTDSISQVLGMRVDYMPYGAAEACTAGTFNIITLGDVDLVGSPFEVATTPCLTLGDNAIETGASPKQQFRLVAQSHPDGVGTCGRAALNCLPEPTVNGEVGNQGLLPLRYRGSGTPGVD